MAIAGRKNWLLDIRCFALLAGLVTLLVYLPALENGFVSWDDDDYLYKNGFIHHLNIEFLGWAFTSFYASNWHPLTWISHALDYAVWELNPLGHHLSNILLHAANTLLVTLFTHKLLSAYPGAGWSTVPNDRTLPMIALITGLLFGLHPLHVESVAWVSERKDLLCAFFYLLSLLFYLRLWHGFPGGMTAGASFRNRNYLVCLALFVLALMSKPMAVSLPLVLLLIDWLLGARIDKKKWRDVFAAKIPFFALALASAAVTVAAQTSGDAITALATVPLIDRVWVAGHALIAYLQKMVWPVDLLPYYPYPKSVAWHSAQYLGSVLLLFAITLIVLMNLRRHRSWAVAWAYYVITLVPVLGIVKVGGQAMADRYTYLPSIAPFMLLAVALVWGVRRLQLRSAWTGAPVVLLLISTLTLTGALSVITSKQIGIWKNGDTLWNHVIQIDDQIPIAYKQLGKGLAERGQYAAAAETMNKALRLDPSDVEVLSNLAICYLELGDLTKAQQSVNKALRMDGDNVAALNTLGEIHLAQEDYSAANQVFLRAMQLEPDNPLRLFNLAVSFDKLQDNAQACITWRRFMSVDLSGQHDAEILQHLAEIGCSLGDP